MSVKKAFVPVQVQSIIVFNPKVCTGCPDVKPEPPCIRACRMNMLLPNPEKGKPPIVIYSEDCCICGCCIHACPRALQGAIKMNWPLDERLRWKRKKTGEHFRLGMSNPPPPNPTPPVSGWYP